jgi:hypothetical protein
MDELLEGGYRCFYNRAAKDKLFDASCDVRNFARSIEVVDKKFIRSDMDGKGPRADRSKLDSLYLIVSRFECCYESL